MLQKDAYSYPEYCDIAYNWNRIPECDFIEECISRYSDIKVSSILDIACGTGIHLREFARRGYDVFGLDKSEEMLEFVRKKAKEEELRIECMCSDLKEFKIDRSFECAICMLDSFRYLLADIDIISHFRSVASVLRKGSLYILDLWMPADGDKKKIKWEEISWSQEAKDVRIKAKYCQRPSSYNPRDKTFEDELVFEIESPVFNSTISSRAKTRVLFFDELKELLRSSGFFDCIARFYNFDFDSNKDYNIKPLRTVIMLKRK